MQGNALDPARQQLLWKWSKGTASLAQFGDPTAGATNYRMCIYDDSALVADIGLSAGDGAHIFALTIETLEALARDAAVTVRALLAEEIKNLNCVPVEIIKRLAQDAEAMSLSESTMLDAEARARVLVLIMKMDRVMGNLWALRDWFEWLRDEYWIHIKGKGGGKGCGKGQAWGQGEGKGKGNFEGKGVYGGNCINFGKGKGKVQGGNDLRGQNERTSAAQDKGRGKMCGKGEQ
jgi:hypothetical protein